MSKSQVIFYDDDLMQCFDVYSIQTEHFEIGHYPEVVAMMSIGNKIELDPTTMLKIAKFNKESEIKALEKKIEKLKEKIIELTNRSEVAEKILNGKIKNYEDLEYDDEYYGEDEYYDY